MEPVYRVRGIPSEHIETFWPFAEAYVKRALDHTSGEVAASDLKRGCMNQNIQLWLVSLGDRVVGAVTTEIVIYPQRKHCRVITIAGSNGDAWTGLMDEMLCAWAKSLGCQMLESYVRKGYVKKLAQYGFKHQHSVVVKEI